MGGVSAGSGLFSGIDSAGIINQLMALEARPKALAQRRILQLQQQQAGFLDLNSKMQALKTAAGNFRLNKTFQSAAAVSSDSDVLTATARAGAVPGSYSFIVDRLVSTQQMLSRGFASSTAGLNAGTFTVESAVARLDRSTALADLNAGAGITRGKITITQGSSSATIDLSKVATADEVVEAINGATGINVSASVEGGRFVVKSTNGTAISIANAGSAQVAESLGIRTSAPTLTVTGEMVYKLGSSTAVSALNDGNGVYLNSQTGNGRFDFQIVVGSVTAKVNIGAKYDAEGKVTEAAPTTVGGIVTRINEALAAALGDSNMTASIAPDGVSLRITDTANRTFRVEENPTVVGATTARDLGLVSGDVTGSLAGRRVLAGLNSTLARTLNGGAGVAGNGAITVTSRDGSVFTVNVDTNGSLSDVVAAFARDTGGEVTAELNKTGTGLLIRDGSGGLGNLIITGDTATSLKIATAPAGVAASVVDSGSLQRQYVTRQTTLASLRSGQGIGTGTFRIVDSTGNAKEVQVGEGTKNLDDLISNINSRGNLVRARINATGDGIELYEEGPGSGNAKIKVEEVSGSVATNLNIKGEAAGTGVQNVINGSYEKKVTFAAGDGLDQIIQKINSANAGVQAALINDGSGTSPFRLSLSARGSGAAGRVVLDTGGFDLGVTTLDRGNDSKVFFGSSDPAQAVLVTSSRNTLDGVIPNVSIDLKSTDTKPVTLTVSRDTSAIETAVGTFISTFNSLSDAIRTQTKYDAESKRGGPLLNDSTANSMRAELAAMALRPAQNVTGQFQRLSDVGITVGKDGKLQMNSERFRAALAQDPEAVERLFTAREVKPQTPREVAPGVTVTQTGSTLEFTSQGMMTLLENFADRYLNTVDGRLTRQDRTLRDQIDAQNARIRSMDQRLASRRQVLEAQFLRMEQAIGRLQQQQGALGQLSQLG